MSRGEKLIEAMKRVSSPRDSEEVDIIVGEVTSATPLNIRINRIVLTPSFLILSPLVKEKKVTVSILGDDIEILLWRALTVGDKVEMLRVRKGQSFYVLQRKEGLE